LPSLLFLVFCNGLFELALCGSVVIRVCIGRGGLVLRVYQKSRGILHSMSLGRVSVNWLLATMEDLLLVEALKEFLKSSRVGSNALIA
jgi:hypothetical protein